MECYFFFLTEQNSSINYEGFIIKDFCFLSFLCLCLEFL